MTMVLITQISSGYYLLTFDITTEANIVRTSLNDIALLLLCEVLDRKIACEKISVIFALLVDNAYGFKPKTCISCPRVWHLSQLVEKRLSTLKFSKRKRGKITFCKQGCPAPVGVCLPCLSLMWHTCSPSSVKFLCQHEGLYSRCRLCRPVHHKANNK